MPDAPDPITSPPSDDYQPYEPTDGAGSVGGWEKLDGGPVDMGTGQLSGDDFPSDGRWRQT